MPGRMYIWVFLLPALVRYFLHGVSLSSGDNLIDFNLKKKPSMGYDSLPPSRTLTTRAHFKPPPLLLHVCRTTLQTTKPSQRTACISMYILLLGQMLLITGSLSWSGCTRIFEVWCLAFERMLIT